MSQTRQRIADLLAAGRSTNEVSAELGIARNTVDYHRTRLATAPPADRGVQPAPPSARHQVGTREAVTQLLAAGLTRAEIARRLRLSKATVSYHARRAGAPVDARCARRYDWAAVQRYYDEGHSVRDCVAAFGFSTQTWHAAVNRGVLVARPAAMPLDELCRAQTQRGRFNLKRRLIGAGVKQDRCETCGITEWRDQPLSLCLHHVNGMGQDNRLENLQLLCPNCHSQTENFAGRNRPRHLTVAG